MVTEWTPELGCEMIECPTGGYVTTDDYEAVRARCLAAETQLARAREAWARACTGRTVDGRESEWRYVQPDDAVELDAALASEVDR